jgi:hypothetical protein
MYIATHQSFSIIHKNDQIAIGNKQKIKKCSFLNTFSYLLLGKNRSKKALQAMTPIVDMVKEAACVIIAPTSRYVS